MTARAEVIDAHEGGAVARYQEPAAPVTPMQMLQLAVQQGADLDKLEKLMALQERWEAKEIEREKREAERAFVVAKAAFKAEAPTVSKNKQVGFDSRRGGSSTSYRHATLDNVADTISPLLSKHGLTYSWRPEQLEGGAIAVTCTLTHVMGHSESVTLRSPADQSGNKNSIQAVGSTITYLERYTLLAVTGIATGDQDDDGGLGGDPGHDEEKISVEQKDRIIEKMREVGADTVAFLKYFKVPTVDDLPAKEFESAMKALDKKAEKARGGR